MRVIEVFVNTFFDKIKIPCDNLKVSKGDKVVIEFDKGIFIGQALSVLENESCDNDYKIIRIASKSDISNSEQNMDDAYSALTETRKMVSKLELDMSVVDAIFSLDKKRLYFSFVADSRVDFRELVKRLAQKYHARIELRQIGVRDKAKKIGGIGPCGLLLCCSRFLNDFTSVSINMAKNQFLALNPNKINGSCGRLMCCLNYENDMYKEMKKGLPAIGNIVETADGSGKVIDVDVFKRTCKVELPNKNIVSMTFGEENGKAR